MARWGSWGTRGTDLAAWLWKCLRVKKKKKEKGEGRGCKVLCSDAEIDNAIVAFEFQCRKMKMMEMVCRLYLKRDIKFCDA